MPKPDASAEEFEASARRYSDACFILLRLQSGRFALFSNTRQLLAIASLEELAQRHDLNTYWEAKPREPADTLLDRILSEESL